MLDFVFLQGHDRRKSCNWLEHPVLDINTVMQAGLSPSVLEKQPALSLYFSSQPPWWPVIMTTQSLKKSRLPVEVKLIKRWRVLWVCFSHLDRHKRELIGNPREEQTRPADMSVRLSACLTGPGTFSPDITSSGHCWVTGQGYSMSRLPAILLGAGEQHKDITQVFTQVTVTVKRK